MQFVFMDWSKSIGGWGEAFGNVVDKKHMAHPPFRQKNDWPTPKARLEITEIIPFTEKTKVKNRSFLVLMDVMSLGTNILQNKGILKLSVTKHMKIST